jgi:hypothetical protein
MLNCPDLDPAIANAAFMEFRASAAWLFDETSPEMLARGRYALATIEDLRPPPRSKPASPRRPSPRTSMPPIASASRRSIATTSPRPRAAGRRRTR